MTPYSEMERVVSQAADAPAAKVFSMATTRISMSIMELLTPDYFTEGLKGIFIDLRCFLYILDASESITMPPNFWAIFPLQVYFATYRLCAITRSRSQKPSGMQECIRLTGLIFINTVLVKNSTHLLMLRNLVNRLRRGLSALDLVEVSLRSPVILMWILFVGAHGSRGQLDRPWFVNLLAGFTRSHDWAGASSELKRFLYLEKEMDKSWQRIWTEAKQARLADP